MWLAACSTVDSRSSSISIAIDMQATLKVELTHCTTLIPSVPALSDKLPVIHIPIIHVDETGLMGVFHRLFAITPF